MQTRTIQIISDVHTEFGVSTDEFRNLLVSADITVLAGDIVNDAQTLGQYLSICKEFSKSVIFICGNHEYHKFECETLAHNGVDANCRDDKYAQVCEKEKIVFLQRNRVFVDGLWFCGATLWSDISDAAGMMLNSPFKVPAIRKMHEKDVKWLSENVQSGDIVITHHLPSYDLIDPQYEFSPVNSAFASDLDDLIKRLNPRLWICGHTHTPFDITVCGVRVVVNPVGYPGENSSFQSKVLDCQIYP